MSQSKNLRPDLIKWAWIGYLGVYLIYAVGDLGALTVPQSPVFFFYQTLTAFHDIYYLYYFLRLLNICCNLLSILPLYLYITHLRLLNPMVWKALFIFRFITDLPGHLFEWNVFQSLLQLNFLLAYSSLFLIFLVIYPSYFACFQYSFPPRQDRVVP